MADPRVSLTINVQGVGRALRQLSETLAGVNMTFMARQNGKTTALQRFAILHAEMGVRSATTIPDGRRRHGITKAMRDHLRHLRKAEARRHR
jgi:hypothetical protein